jgi:hypothetical protein
MPTDSEIIKILLRLLDALRPPPVKRTLEIVVGPVANPPPPPPPDVTLSIVVGPIVPAPPQESLEIVVSLPRCG